VYIVVVESGDASKKPDPEPSVSTQRLSLLVALPSLLASAT
jgi:hypothetical protein